MCNNTKGPFNCSCKTIYIGDGSSCTGKILRFRPMSSNSLSVVLYLAFISESLCSTFFQILTSAHQEHTNAVRMPCVSTARRDRTSASVTQDTLETEEIVQVKFGT